MLIYEVDLEVDEDINYKVAGWLTEYVHEVVKHKGFQALQWFFRLPHDEGRDPKENKTLWTLQYLVDDRTSLDDYLKDQEPKMKDKLNEQYGDKVVYKRRVLNLLRLAGPAYDNLQSVQEPAAQP